MKIDTIFEFVRFSIDDSVTTFESSDDLDWDSMYDFAVKQTIVGVLYAGLEQMNDAYEAAGTKAIQADADEMVCTDRAHQGQEPAA